MFGLDATEMLVLVIVGIVVVGPKKLPQMMRTAGQWIAKLRKMSSSLRSQSGIDEILRIEGLEKEMRELRALTRINVMDSLVNAAEKPLPVRAPRQLSASGGATGAVGVPANGSSGASGASSGGADDAIAEPKGGSVARTSPRSAAASKAISRSSDAASSPYDVPEAGTDTAVVKPAVVKTPGEAPPGAIPRARPRAPVVMVALPGEAPLVAREWPVAGCDAYDAIPDDLEELEEAAAAAEAAAAEAEAATAGGAVAAGDDPAAAQAAVETTGTPAADPPKDPAASPPASAGVT